MKIFVDGLVGYPARQLCGAVSGVSGVGPRWRNCGDGPRQRC